MNNLTYTREVQIQSTTINLQRMQWGWQSVSASVSENFITKHTFLCITGIRYWSSVRCAKKYYLRIGCPVFYVVCEVLCILFRKILHGFIYHTIHHRIVLYLYAAYSLSFTVHIVQSLKSILLGFILSGLLLDMFCCLLVVAAGVEMRNV